MTLPGRLPPRSRTTQLLTIWRLFALCALAMLAYQVALHLDMYLQLPAGERLQGSMPFIPAMLGTPIAAGWAAIAAVWARYWTGSWMPSGRMLRATAVWTLIVVFVFAVYVAWREDWETVRFWLWTIVFVTGFSMASFPMALAIYVGFATWKLVALMAIGIPSVGPMLMLLCWTRPRDATAVPG